MIYLMFLPGFYSHQRLLLTVLTLAGAVGKGAAQRRLVPQQFPTIQAAIRAATPHDTVLVSPGVYYENLRFGGKPLVVASTFLLAPTDTDLIRRTVIDGSRPAHPDTASVVRFVDGEDSTTALIGFTLTGGRGTRWRDPHSPGVFREGGGILAQDASPVIRHNLIRGNVAIDAAGWVSAGGGGVRVDGGRPQLLNNVIIGNRGRYGAGVVVNYAGAVLRNNLIVGNQGGEDFGGGGVWLNGAATGAPVVIENNTIAGNTSAGAGGGIHLFAGVPGVLRNTIVWANAAVSGPQIGNPASLDATYTAVAGPLALPGAGNGAAYPQLRDSAAVLLPTSPAIDAGDPAAGLSDPAGGTPGWAGWPGQGSRRNDQGAYGGPGATRLPVPADHVGVHTPGFVRLPNTPVGRQATARIAVLNQGLSRLWIDSMRVRAGSALTVLTPGPRQVAPLDTDSARLTWTVVSTGQYVDTLRIYHRAGGLPNPWVVRIVGIGTRPMGEGPAAAAPLVRAFPVPADAGQALTLAVTLPAPAVVEWVVRDAGGRTVWTQPARQQPAGPGQQVIPAGTLPAGLYVAQVVVREAGGGGRTHARRLLVCAADGR